MNERLKQNLIVTAFGISLLTALMNLSAVLQFIKIVIKVISPIIIGSILALFINVPLSFIESKLSKRYTNLSKRKVHIISFIITLLCIVTILGSIISLVVPEIIYSYKNVYEKIITEIPEISNIEKIKGVIDNSNLSLIVKSIKNEDINTFLISLKNVMKSMIWSIVNIGFSLVISIYITIEKELVCRHTDKLIRAYIPEKLANKIVYACNVFNKSFKKFLSGQCTEAMLLGLLTFLGFVIFRLPYAAMIGLLTAVCAIIPYIGPFISFTISMVLILLTDYTFLVKAIIVYEIIQISENQLLYPRVVGGSVGLPPLYTLIAAMIGGKLFGIVGILFFIPLMATVVEIIKTDANNRLIKDKDKEIKHEDIFS